MLVLTFIHILQVPPLGFPHPPDTLLEIIHKAVDNANELKVDNSLDVSLGNQISGVSLVLTVELLRLYHEWLSEQIQ